MDKEKVAVETSRSTFAKVTSSVETASKHKYATTKSTKHRTYVDAFKLLIHLIRRICALTSSHLLTV